MKSLEEECEELERLDQFRIESADMRDQGRKALRLDGNPWERTDSSVIEDAHVVKALCDRKDGPPPELVSKLEKLKAREILSNAEEENVPTLRAARCMQALAAAPDSAFSEPLLVFYYQIVREIYTADAPDWRIGGARAAPGGNTSAYVTGECVRAILGFAKSLDNTSTFMREVTSLRQRRRRLLDQQMPELWCRVELERLRRDFYTSVVRLTDNIALKLESPNGGQQRKLFPLTPSNADAFIAKAPGKIRLAVNRVVRAFEKVKEEVERFRSAEELEIEQNDPASTSDNANFNRIPAQRRYERSATGHAVALGALQQGLASAKAASKLFTDNEDVDQALEQLTAMFQSVASGVRRLLHPARAYLSTVLDRELTAASSEARPRWDPAEMAFAACSYGFAAGNFEDDRLRRAGICLSEEISERGRFRCRGYIYVDSTGRRLEVLGSEILRAFVQLLENVDAVPVDERLLRSVLLFFRDTKRSFRQYPDLSGWCPEEVQEPAPPLLWVTAIAVLALDRVNRMLDARINARVFRHFSVKKGRDLKIPPLRALFYPDYGIRHRDLIPKGEGSWEREQPVALVLERMRAHALGLSRLEKPVPPLFSLILYGPPGTGKTTLVEALAKSAEVPLLEITPSDIVSSGADVVERRARAVFKALSLLTRVVILFDEFDPVLKRRSTGDLEPSTVFSFVTPGMLPKLKTLHESAKRRSVTYVLITNLIGVLDGAAVRSGRFDCKLGIYPPDPLSREGRLLDEILAYRPRSEWPRDLRERVQEVVKRTGGAQIEDLVREGWFRSPEGSRLPEGSPFAYIAGASTFDPVEKPEAEVKLQPPARRGPPTESEKAAEREYRQRTWLREWEAQVDAAGRKKFTPTSMKPPEQVPSLVQKTAQPREVYLSWAATEPEQSEPIRLYVTQGNGQDAKLESGKEDPNA